MEITSYKWASQEPQIRRRVSIRDVDGVVDVLLLEQAYDDQAELLVALQEVLWRELINFISSTN